MKFIAISFAALFKYASSNEDKAGIHGMPPKLRATIVTNGYAAAKEVAVGLAIEDQAAKKKNFSMETRDMTSRQRISQYALEKQMWFIMDAEKDPVPWLYEDPSKEPLYPNLLQWVCAPTHAPDFNGDGMYDSLVAHAVSFIPPKTSEGANNRGATFNGQYMTHGYSASWSDETGYYDEYIVDYDDTSVEHIKGTSVTIYETSPAGGRGGFTASGEGEWAFVGDDHPMLQMLADALGVDRDGLTPELCAEKYAEVWTAATNGPPPSVAQ